MGYIGFSVPLSLQANAKATQRLLNQSNIAPDGLVPLIDVPSNRCQADSQIQRVICHNTFFRKNATEKIR